MCGIVLAASGRNVVPILIEGIRRLEYRGYDSTGLAVLDSAHDGALARLVSTARVADLDAEAQAEILALLRRLASEGVGVLVVLHDLSYAAAYCDRMILMHEGRLVVEGPPARVVTAEHINAVYGRHVRVLPHPEGGAPLVVPAL